MKAHIRATRAHGIDVYRPCIQWADGRTESAQFFSEAYARNWIALRLYKAAQGETK